MDNKAICWVTTFDVKGDGYTNYSVPICEELTKRGYFVFGFGVAYNRAQHPWSFGVTHAKLDRVSSILASVSPGLKPVANIVAMDIPQQIQYMQQLQKNNALTGMNYIPLYAVESDPLSSSWAMHMMAAQKHFTISQFGADECSKFGIEATHLPAVLDLEAWKPKSAEEKAAAKDALGMADKILFFMNADGNERKNTALVYEALAELKKVRQDFHFILLTRTKSPVGWDYTELATRFGLNGFTSVLDRGLKISEVRNLYVAADFVLNVTKAEGLGMAVLEAQAVRTPVIATNVTGMRENISDGRGIAVEPDFKIVDIFGNGNRYFVNHEKLAALLNEHCERMKSDPGSYDQMLDIARASIEARTIEKTVDIFEKVINNE